MKKVIEKIRESEVEDAIITYLDILEELLVIDKEIRLMARKLRLTDGKRRLDILITVGDEIFLLELKTEQFHSCDRKRNISNSNNKFFHKV